MPEVSSRSTAAPEITAGAISCRLARGEDELGAHFELRRAVFVVEQGMFAGDDRDEHDDRPETLHALGLLGEHPCGAVRLYPRDRDGVEWKGDRLAVLPELRTHHLGAALVRFAVSTAGWLGGQRMIAHVQLPNVRFFEYLGWKREGGPGGRGPFHGVDHQLMSIGLGRDA